MSALNDINFTIARTFEVEISGAEMNDLGDELSLNQNTIGKIISKVAYLSSLLKCDFNRHFHILTALNHNILKIYRKKPDANLFE